MKITELKQTLSEHQIQAAYITWCKWQSNNDKRYESIIGIPNAAKRGPAVASRMLAEGLSKGVPDVLILCPNATRHGAAIEFKRPGGRLSEAQDVWLKRLSSWGWAVTVCFSIEEAISFTQWYFRS